MTDATSTAVLRAAAVPAGWTEDLRKRALWLAVPAVAASVAGAFASPEHFFRAYLTGFVFWLGVPLGCLGLLLLTHMTGGSWALVMRRLLEAATRTLPFLVLLFVPVLLGMRTLYAWTDAETVAASAILQHKAPYLNLPFFLGRAAVYFLVWGLFAFLLNRWSLEQDRTGATTLPRRLQGAGGVGLLAFMLAGSFASFDWLMSLDPLWFSSIYGMHFVVGQAATGLCFAILVARSLGRSQPLDRVYASRHLDDYGKLLLAFILLWGYMTYSQYLIIWSGNLPEEITWYIHRHAGGYKVLSFVIFALHFGVPFFLLLSKGVRTHPQRLVWAALPVFVGHWLDLVWQVAPSLDPEGPALHWLDPVVTLAIGGVWLVAFAWQLPRRALLPQRDPLLEVALADE